MSGILSLAALALTAALLGTLYWDNIRPILFANCRHGIAYESICVECRAREDRRG
jgi:hypothetical protein